MVYKIFCFWKQQGEILNRQKADTVKLTGTWKTSFCVSTLKFKSDTNQSPEKNYSILCLWFTFSVLIPSMPPQKITSTSFIFIFFYYSDAWFIDGDKSDSPWPDAQLRKMMRRPPGFFCGGFGGDFFGFVFCGRFF